MITRAHNKGQGEECVTPTQAAEFMICTRIEHLVTCKSNNGFAK